MFADDERDLVARTHGQGLRATDLLVHAVNGLDCWSGLTGHGLMAWRGTARWLTSDGYGLTACRRTRG
jgi:hypothetical protein